MRLLLFLDEGVQWPGLMAELHYKITWLLLRPSGGQLVLLHHTKCIGNKCKSAINSHFVTTHFPGLIFDESATPDRTLQTSPRKPQVSVIEDPRQSEVGVQLETLSLAGGPKASWYPSYLSTCASLHGQLFAVGGAQIIMRQLPFCVYTVCM